MSDTITPDWKEAAEKYFTDIPKQGNALMRLDASHHVIRYFEENVVQPLQSSLNDLQFKNSELESALQAEKLAHQLTQAALEEKEKEKADFENEAVQAGKNILSKGYEIIDGAFRKSVVEVPVIISEFERIGYDILEYPEF